MTKYVIQRILLAIVTAFIILSLTYLLIAALPPLQTAGMEPQLIAFYDDQVRLGFQYKINVNLGQNPDFVIPDGSLWSYVDKNNITTFYYARSAWDQYISWLTNIVTKWDWGRSNHIQLNFSAMGIIAERLPVSLVLNIFSVIISVPLGILLGIIAGLKKNSFTDHVISTLVMIFISIPSFVTITFMLWIFAYQLGWLPTQWPMSSAANSTKVLAYIIPVASLSFGSICGYCRFVRAELCEVMSSEYLLLARTKGLTKNQAIIRHALRNAFVPILPSILAEFIGILGGSMILESIYGIPGIGSLYITALNTRDYSVLMVDMAVFTSIGLMANIVLDLSYGFIDPRIRMGAR